MLEARQYKPAWDEHMVRERDRWRDEAAYWRERYRELWESYQRNVAATNQKEESDVG